MQAILDLEEVLEEFHTISKSSKNFHDLLKSLQAILSSLDLSKLSVFDKMFSSQRFLTNFEFFVFSQLTKAYKVQKTPELAERFLGVTLKFGSKYVDIRSFEEIPKINCLKTNKGFDLMGKALETLPLELIISDTEKAAENKKIYLILSWLEMKKNSESCLRLEPTLQARLKEEYFIDFNARKPNGFKFIRPMRMMISEKAFEGFYLPSMLKLLKRTENNIDIMRTIFSADLPIDLSKCAEEIVLGNLKEYFFGKNSESCIFITIQTIKGMKNFDSIMQLLKKLDGLIKLTNNEQHKMIILQMFEGFILKLLSLETQQRLTLQKELLSSLFLNFAMISQEDLIPIMKKLIESFIENSIEMQLDSKEVSLLKSNIANQKNKFALLSTLYFSLNYLKKFTVANPDFTFSELAPIFETITAQILTPNLKNSQKLVSIYQQFILALEIVFMSFPYKEASKNIDFESICSFFSDSILIHQAKFVQKAGFQELSGIVNTIVLATVYFCEENHEFFETSEWKNLCANTFVQCLLEKGMTTNYMKNIFKKMTTKIKPKINNLVIRGLFFKIFFSEVNETKELEKIRWLLKYLSKNLKDLEFQENEIFQFIFLIYHEEISSESILSSFLKEYSKEKEITEKFYNFFQSKSLEILTFLFSNSGVFSKKKNNFRAALSYFKAFIDFKNEEFVNFFQVFLDENNFYDGEAIEKFEENLNSLKENNIFLNSLENAGKFLISVGFLENKLHVLYEEYSNVQLIKEKPAAAKKPGHKTQEKKPSKKQAGNKAEAPTKKMEVLDEGEIAKLILEQLYQKIWSYYEKISLIYKIFSSRIYNNSVGLALFYNKIYPGLVSICSTRQDFRGGFLDILHAFYEFNPKLKKYRLVLAELLIKKMDYESPGETHHEDLMKLLAFLQNYLNEKEQKEALDFWEELMRYVLRNKEFDLKAKNLGLSFLFALAKMEPLAEKIGLIYEEIISNINALANFEELLLVFLNFLLPKLPSKVKALSIMFENILDISERAKETCLKSVFVLLSSQNATSNDISFEIVMKIRIIQLNTTPEISSQCEKLLSLINYEDKPEDIVSFEIVEFLRNNSKESLDDFCRIATELIKTKPLISASLLKTILSGTKGLLETEKADDDKFLFFPQFIKMNLSIIEEFFLEEIFSILIENLCRESNKTLTEEALEIGKELIRFHGPKYFEKISGFLNAYLDKKTLDKGQQICAVVFIGVVSPFITNSSKVNEITCKVLELLESSDDNQSQQVNLSRCLSDMIILFPDALKKIEEHLNTIFSEKNKKKQLFSAYLISGLIRGIGIDTIESLKIFDKIESYMEGIFKKEIYIKEAILHLLGALYDNNGKVLEPYLPRFMLILMQFFGDNNEGVRSMSLLICRSAISKLSSFGVKNVLPLLLKGLDEKSMNWKAKLANISALGNLAYCSPKQLSLSLPQIIPKLTATLSDTHPKIREGADDALKVIGKTIKNPEVSENVDILIKAINNPFDENKKGLEVLLKTQFVHYIDIPALSLIIPIIDYGLRSRESALKENASQIVGTISHLIKNPRDLLPYLDILVNALKISVCDPIGTVRNISAKAFGALAKKLGEFNSAKILRTLKGILESPESKSNEKSGAAQAYSEVICAIGVEYFDRNKDYILAKTLETKQHLKESYIGLFIYLPAIMDEAFEPYLSIVLDNLVESLSDENESIRSLTLRVVKILIDKFGMKNTQLLLAPINDGLFNINMRKRNSSINLTGDLLKVLYKSRSGQGSEGYNAIYEETLASVYVLKHDEYEVIKNTADNVWKENVANTPKVLKQLLPVLIKKLIELMSLETGIEKLAQNTIKEYCGKYSDSVFYDFLEILEKRSKVEEPNFRGIYLSMFLFIIIFFFLGLNRLLFVNLIYTLLI